MQKSGYMQVSNAPACDPSGKKCRIIEVSTVDGRYAIEAPELSRLISYGRKCPVRHLTHYYGKRLGDIAGAVTLSVSKKGLIIEIFPCRKYITSRSAAESLLKGYMNYTKISEIQAENRGINQCTNPTIQSPITPWVAV